MNETKYRRIIYFISLVIALTLAVQGYWAYRTFQAEKQELLADVQFSLDSAIDTYFTQLAKESTFNYVKDSVVFSADTLIVQSNRSFKLLDSVPFNQLKHLSIKDSANTKSLSLSTEGDLSQFTLPFSVNDSIFAAFQDLRSKPLNELTSKIIISFTEDELDIAVVDSLLKNEFNRNQIWIDYSLAYNSLWRGKQVVGDTLVKTKGRQVQAASSFIASDDTLTLYFNNTTPLILHRNGVSFGLSLLFVGCIIFSLMYLLKIIQNQKELAAIKNDLISNITHEFKTPLATIGVALEGIERFNTTNDAQKSKKYAALSAQQVQKLSHMVDKLLETATLDSNSLELKKETIDLIPLLEKMAIVPEAFISSKKELLFKTDLAQCLIKADPFHLENVLHTIIDNAFKYGGDRIEVAAKTNKKEVYITITDNGTELTKAQIAKIFEKFYRVPKGNNHDVKGFGIGLYYAKNIIEKHGGSIAASIKNETTFTLTLPHE